MKNLKDFLEDLQKDKNFAKNFEGLSQKEMVKFAKKEGYSFTEEDLMEAELDAVSGGSILSSLENVYNKGKDIYNKGKEMAPGVIDNTKNMINSGKDLYNKFKDLF